jgi:hypothetical protein
MSNSHAGSISITPPLNWSETKKFETLVRAAYTKAVGNSSYRVKGIDKATDLRTYLGFGAEVEEHEEDREEGLMTVRTCRRLSFHDDADYLSLGVAEITRVLIAAFPKHTVKGTTISVDEEFRSPVKVVVKDGKALVVKGETVIRWEDGSPENSVRLMDLSFPQSED